MSGTLLFIINVCPLKQMQTTLYVMMEIKQEPCVNYTISDTAQCWKTTLKSLILNMETYGMVDIFGNL